MSSFKSNFLKNIRLKNVKIAYDDFDICPEKSFEEQKWSFKEDILQLTMGNNYIVDVGWYPEHSPCGFFRIEVIKNFDWEYPLFEKKCKDIMVLKNYLQEAIDFVNHKGTVQSM